MNGLICIGRTCRGQLGKLLGFATLLIPLMSLMSLTGCSGESPEATMLKAIYTNDVALAKKAIKSGVHPYSYLKKGEKIPLAWMTGNKADEGKVEKLEHEFHPILRVADSTEVLELYLNMNPSDSALELIITGCYKLGEYASVERIYKTRVHLQSPKLSAKNLASIGSYSDDLHKHILKLISLGMTPEQLGLKKLFQTYRDIRLLGFFKQDGANINSITVGGEPVIMKIYNKLDTPAHEAFFLELVRQGADYQQADRKGVSILATVISRNATKNPLFFDQLVEAGVDLNYNYRPNANKPSRPMAFLVAEQLGADNFKKAVKHGMDPSVIQNGRTLAHLLKMDPAALKEMGVDIDYRNPLSLAIQKNKMEYAYALIEAGCEYWRSTKMLKLIATPKYATLRKHVHLALKNGPKDHTRSRFLNEMSIWLNSAIKIKDFETAQLIAKTGMNLNQPANDEAPLKLALDDAPEELILAMVKAGADPSPFLNHDRLQGNKTLKSKVTQAAN